MEAAHAKLKIVVHQRQLNCITFWRITEVSEFARSEIKKFISHTGVWLASDVKN